MILHPSFKKMILFCFYLSALAYSYALFDVDMSYIESENAKFYNKIKDVKINNNIVEKNDSILISLNKAVKKELMKLDYIGEKTAEKIIDFRKKTPFKKIEDIMKIKGIGKKRFLKIKKNLTL